MKIIQKVFFLLVVIIYPNFSFAQNSALDNKELNKQVLEEIESYLNGVKNLSADFVQKSQDSSIIKGKFYLSRPGKMRVEYNSSNSLRALVIVNNSVLSYHDLDLDEISNLSTNSTPASLLTRKNISFDAKDVKVTSIGKNAEYCWVSVVKKNRPEAGEFKIIFKNNPLNFVKMEVKNDFGEIVYITLENIKFPENIDNELFVVKNKNLPF